MPPPAIGILLPRRLDDGFVNRLDGGHLTACAGARMAAMAIAQPARERASS